MWQFELEDYDIGFQVLENGTALREIERYKAGGVAHPTQDGNSNDLLTNGKTEKSECDAQHSAASEAWIESHLDNLTQGGTYTFRWDNSYSLVRHKRLQYRFLVTSKRAFAAAETAAQESNAKQLHETKKNRWSGSLQPHLARRLARERALQKHERAAEQDQAIETLQLCVTDMVSAFMAKPDSPLHEGSVRPFILALETVLRNGIKVGLFLRRQDACCALQLLLEPGR